MPKAKVKKKTKPRGPSHAQRVREIVLAQAEIERDRLLLAGMRQALEARDAVMAEVEVKFTEYMTTLVLLVDKLKEDK